MADGHAVMRDTICGRSTSLSEAWAQPQLCRALRGTAHGASDELHSEQAVHPAFRGGESP
jgi:hypothetical protein